ncbi:hypothetical protein BJ138DRAFT_1018981 [Hygrophoropsis aurantiaca]|uniref:Uncharacterized protein n=1 Tax=Hygrophoropsis aurantiaca TaxID=72124 RepID=A0ACB7ZUM3_9AGAM|nr:hypothetical protein BJ138DRAFT_1018981 [Hygrophoropsis aurantiaca]
MLRVSTSISKDALGCLPLIIGMPLVVTENIASSSKIVNGSEGILRDVRYSLDDAGHRIAECAYVYIEGSEIHLPGLDKGVVPVFPTTQNFKYFKPAGGSFTISRKQLPLLPGWSCVDYKVQGRSMQRVIVDLCSATKLSNVYVMLSRSPSLQNLAILQEFSSRKIFQSLSQELRDELARLDKLSQQTLLEYNQRHNIT